jgi:signal transduction histidine kinase
VPPIPSRPRSSLLPALRRLSDRVLEAPDRDALARLLTRELPGALGLPRADLLLWDRKLDSFQALSPGETHLHPVQSAPAELPETRWLVAEGALLETPGEGGEGVLLPLTARSGLIGMLVLSVAPGRRRVPFRPSEARLLSALAARCALALENQLYQRELVASERMAALGTMAGMLAHDFRGPMTVIRGYAELLQDGPATPEEVRERARLIVRMVDRLERMTGETLDFARGGGTLARRRLGLRAFLKDLAVGLQDEYPGLEVSAELSLPEDAAGELDADKLRRAIGNLAANARDAMGGRGRLRLRAELEPPGHGPEARLALVVADEGPGVPAEIRDRLFDPFVTRGKKGGTGLGLAVARRFVEEHAGTIELLPEGPGARFRIALPLRPPAPPQ